MQSVLLSQIADVVAGYSFRSALEASENGGVLVFQAQNISENKKIMYNMTRIDLNLPKTQAFLQPNDVLLSARGSFKSVCIGTKFLTQTVASSSVYILRVKSDQVIPEFLSIYLNSQQGQNSLRRYITGGTIKTILKSDLENIEVVLPSLEVQRHIIDFKKNWMESKKLLKKKLKLSESVVDATINKLLTFN